MADYTELFNLLNYSTLRNKIEMAVSEATRIIQSGGDTDPPFSQSTVPIDYPAQRRKWARRVIGNESAEAQRFMHLVLMANKTATVAQIQAATDTPVQNNINALIDLIAEGEV
jgi:hypothetical protein